MRRLAAAALTALLLAACTGTSEPRPATLLVVGAAPAGTPQLLLVQDATGTAPQGAPRLVVVPGSARTLPAPAVAIDFEDRALDRDAAWVLTRQVAASGGTPQVTAYLHRFRVAAVDPADPAGFAEDATRRVTLTEPGGTGVLDGVSPTSPLTCPAALQVDRDGEWAVVLDDPARCGSSDHPEVWLVPLSGGPPVSLQGTNDVAPLPPYLDQRPDQQVVYFLVDGINDTHVYRRRLDLGTATRLGSSQVAVPKAASLLADAAGAGDLYLAVGDGALFAVDLVTPASRPRADARSGARGLAVDPTGAAAEVLVLEPSTIAFHEDPSDGSPDTAASPAVAGTVDPLTRFAYVVGQQRLTIVDLLTGGQTDRAFQAYTEQVDELVLPAGAPSSLPGADTRPVTVIGWVRASTPTLP